MVFCLQQYDFSIKPNISTESWLSTGVPQPHADINTTLINMPWRHNMNKQQEKLCEDPVTNKIFVPFAHSLRWEIPEKRPSL